MMFGFCKPGKRPQVPPPALMSNEIWKKVGMVSSEGNPAGASAV